MFRQKSFLEIEMEISKRDKEGEIKLVGQTDVAELDRGIRTEGTYGVKVRIKDFGVGIDQESLLQISKVGTSLMKKQGNVREMPEWLRPTAEFGVGLQSAFLITPTFKCKTHTRTGERYEITFGSGARAQYGGYINVKPVTRFEGKDDTYGTCFELFVAENQRMRYEEFPDGWDGEDYFDEKYEKRRPLRHSVELLAQMALYLDSLIGESLFPIHLCVRKISGVNIPLNTTDKNTVYTIKYHEEQVEEIINAG